MANYHVDSYKSIKITNHAMIRAEQRLGTANTSEIRKMAFAARKKGVKVWLLNKDNKKESGLDDNTYYLLKNKLRVDKSGNSNTPYYYKGNIFLFRGKYQLVTIIPLEVLKH